MVVGVIGTTITPWMQFYLQSSIVEKGIAVRQYKNSRWDVIVGSIFTDIVAWFIVVACAATLYTHGIRNIVDASDAAGAMKPLAGDYAFILFAAGLFNASLFAASILPLSTAYTVCEGLGFESGLDKILQGSKILLLVLHPAPRRRSSHRPDPQLPAGPVQHSVAGAQRRPAPHRSGLHAQAHQQARAHGQVHQFAPGSTSSPGSPPPSSQSCHSCGCGTLSAARVSSYPRVLACCPFLRLSSPKGICFCTCCF